MIRYSSTFLPYVFLFFFLSSFHIALSQITLNRCISPETEIEKSLCEEIKTLHGRLKTCQNTKQEKSKKIRHYEDEVVQYEEEIQACIDSIIFYKNEIIIISRNVPDDNFPQVTFDGDSATIIRNLVVKNQKISEEKERLENNLAYCQDRVRTLKIQKQRLILQKIRLEGDTTRMGIEIRVLRRDTMRMGFQIRDLMRDTTRMGVEIRGLRKDTTRMGFEIRGLRRDTAILKADLKNMVGIAQINCTKIYAEYKMPFVRKKRNIIVLIERKILEKIDIGKTPRIKAGRIQRLIFSTCAIDMEEEGALADRNIRIAVNIIAEGSKDTMRIEPNPSIKLGKSKLQGGNFAYYVDNGNVVFSTRVEDEGFFKRFKTARKEKRWLYLFRRNKLKKGTRYQYEIIYGNILIAKGGFKTYPL